jgi:hypothetical protein
MNPRNMAASVRARLLNRARETRQDFNLICTPPPVLTTNRADYKISIL